MSDTTIQHDYTIKEAAALTGLPASTLRYYESIGVIPRIGRGESSRHRVYTDDDLNMLTGVACLSATGMSVSDMRSYMANGNRGQAGADEQIALLATQQEHLAREAELIALRQRYVALKIDYWRAVSAGDEPGARRVADEARGLADELTRGRRTSPAHPEQGGTA